MVDMTTSLSGIEFDNPVIPASGTFGFGYIMKQTYDLNILGGIALKGATKEERIGNPTPRIAECTNALINSVGLQNPGIDKVLSEELPRLTRFYNKRVIANISGFSIDEYKECCEKADKEERIDIIEVNISCPNVHNGGMSFGTDSKSAESVVKAVKEVTHKPIYMKLTPNVTDIKEIAKACEGAGADGLSLINTIQAMRINLKSRKPIIARKIGGMSGPAIFPIALRNVYEVYESVKIPIMGMGGISTAEDVIEMMLAGASAVQVGAANIVNPFACKDIIESLPETMEKYRITSLREIIGEAHL